MNTEGYSRQPKQPKRLAEWWSVRAWDLAVTDKTDADHTAGVLMTLTNDSHLYIRDMIHLQANWPRVRATILETAMMDGPNVEILMPESATQKGFLDDLKISADFKHFIVSGIPETTAKLVRANRWIARLFAGKVTLIDGGPWVPGFLAECEEFTGHDDPHDDRIDAISIGYHRLAAWIDDSWDGKNELDKTNSSGDNASRNSVESGPPRRFRRLVRRRTFL